MPEKIIFFDLDHTLLKGNGSFHFGSYLYKKGFIPISQMLTLFANYTLHKMGILSPEHLNNSACKTFFSGKCINAIQGHVDSFLHEHLNELLNFPITKRLVDAHQQGYYTVILSSSPHFLVEAIANRLGVDQWGSTQYALDKTGNITHVESHMDGKSKALYVNSLCSKLNIPIQNTTAYSDSYHDLHFLQAAGTAKGVNPDRKLKKYCLANNWEII